MILCYIFVTVLFFIQEVKCLKPEGCDPSSNSLFREGILGQVGMFPWLGVIRVDLHEGVTIRTALTGAILVKEKYALSNADDIARMPRKIFERDSRALFIPRDDEPWLIKLKNYITHPEYPHIKNTIALIELELENQGPVPLIPVCWQTHLYDASKELYVLGITDENNVLEKEVYKVQYVQESECMQWYETKGFNTENDESTDYQCVFTVNNKKQCVFETGMVLASNATGIWTLLAFGIYGPGCASPSRFIEMSKYIPWIEATTDVSRGISGTGISGDQNVPIHQMFRSGLNKIIPYSMDYYEVGLAPEVVRIDRTAIAIFNNMYEMKQGDCFVKSKLIYSDSFKIHADYQQGRAYYQLSLMELSMMNYTCVLVRVNAGKRSNATLWFNYGDYIEPLPGLETPKELLKKYPLPKRDDDIEDDILTTTSKSPTTSKHSTETDHQTTTLAKSQAATTNEPTEDIDQITTTNKSQEGDETTTTNESTKDIDHITTTNKWQEGDETATTNQPREDIDQITTTKKTLGDESAATNESREDINQITTTKQPQEGEETATTNQPREDIDQITTTKKSLGYETATTNEPREDIDQITTTKQSQEGEETATTNQPRDDIDQITTTKNWQESYETATTNQPREDIDQMTSTKKTQEGDETATTNQPREDIKQITTTKKQKYDETTQKIHTPATESSGGDNNQRDQPDGLDPILRRYPRQIINNNRRYKKLISDSLINDLFSIKNELETTKKELSITGKADINKTFRKMLAIKSQLSKVQDKLGNHAPDSLKNSINILDKAASELRAGQVFYKGKLMDIRRHEIQQSIDLIKEFREQQETDETKTRRKEKTFKKPKGRQGKKIWKPHEQLEKQYITDRPGWEMYHPHLNLQLDFYFDEQAEMTIEVWSYLHVMFPTKEPELESSTRTRTSSPKKTKSSTNTSESGNSAVENLTHKIDSNKLPEGTPSGSHEDTESIIQSELPATQPVNTTRNTVPSFITPEDLPPGDELENATTSVTTLLAEFLPSSFLREKIDDAVGYIGSLKRVFKKDTKFETYSELKRSEHYDNIIKIRGIDFFDYDQNGKSGIRSDMLIIIAVVICGLL